MLSIDEKNYSNEELYYYNLVEQNKITLEELGQVNINYPIKYSNCFVDIETQRPFLETEENILEEVKENFIKYAKLMCSAYIELGVDIELSDGNTYHFSLTSEDQQNINLAYELANLTKESVPYHADNNTCKLYTVEDISKIHFESAIHITYYQTCFNLLKEYIKNCNDAETIIKSYYLMKLPDEYDEILNAIIAHSQTLMSSISAEVINNE